MTGVTDTSAIRTIDDLDVAGKRALVRVDFNVPMKDGVILDDRRIKASLPTLTALRERGAELIIVSHLGRPGGVRSAELSLAPVATRLAELTGWTVALTQDVGGPDSRRVIDSVADSGAVVMLENVRFDPGEEANDSAFAQRLADLADVYVNDAFGTAHRAHASTEGVALLLRSGAGFLMARELEVLGGLFTGPRRPIVAIVGGAKVSSKIGVITSLLAYADELWIGGAMATTFFRARGAETGTSLVEETQIGAAKAILTDAENRNVSLRLPSDVVVTTQAVAGALTHVVQWDAIPADEMAVDIGPATVLAMSKAVAEAGTVVWNGPLGVYEVEDFAVGTRSVAQAVGASAATTVIGGGDLAKAVDDAGVADRITHISTGGGATLEFLEGKSLPGVAVLSGRLP